MFTNHCCHHDSTDLKHQVESITLTNIFKWLGEFGQLVQALFYYIRRPLIDLVMLVGTGPNCPFYGLLDNVADFIHHKGSLEYKQDSQEILGQKECTENCIEC